MATQHIVVDGSNIATEGRSTPSLDQLEGAVVELRREFPDAEVTVVVDATFAHRIDPSELARYEQASLRGEMISPPAGAIGRGDAFLLRIAEKVEAMVLSNDSFQEFHGEHAWLFDRGRLLGATPVPGIGWIFVPRTPVRGPKSRVAVRDATRARARVEKAIAQATKEAVEPKPSAAAKETSRRQRPAAAQPQAVNDPSTFIAFIAEHRLGDQIEAEVESFSSHGAVVRYGEVRCYVPLAGLGTPPPRSAREVLHKGELRTFAVTALDPYRRGVELGLPDAAVVSGHPSAETVAAEVRMARTGHKPGAEEPAAPAPRRRRAARSGAPSLEETPAPAQTAVEPPAVTPRRRARRAEVPSAAPVTPQAVPGAATSPRRRRAKAAATPQTPTGAPATSRSSAPTTPAGSPPVAAKKAPATKKKASAAKKAPAAETAPAARPAKVAKKAADATKPAVAKKATRAKAAPPASAATAQAAKKPPARKQAAKKSSATKKAATTREAVPRTAAPSGARVAKAARAGKASGARAASDSSAETPLPRRGRGAKKLSGDKT